MDAMTGSKVLLFGGCLSHGALNTVSKTTKAISFARVASRRGTPATYTLGEALQLLAFLGRERPIPLEMRTACAVSTDYEPMPKVDYSIVDVALVEVISNVEFWCGPYCLNRTAVLDIVCNPIKARGGRPAAKAASAWINQGLMGCNEQVRASAAAALLTMIPDEHPQSHIVQLILRETRGMRRVVADGLREIQERLGRPIGVVSYVFQYMADGRTIYWPPELQQQTYAAVKLLDLPLFEPCTIVLREGVTKAMRSDLRHYDDAFLPVAGKELAAFANQVAAAAKPSVASRPQVSSFPIRFTDEAVPAL
jgi:hypothetical protein